MTANKMMPTNGKRPEGLKDKDWVVVQYPKIDPVFSRVEQVEWYYAVAWCTAELPAPYVPEPDYSKWVGKVCKFWNVAENNGIYDVLVCFTPSNAVRFPFKCSNCVYMHCRPVTADEIVKE